MPGALLLGQTDRAIRLTERFAASFSGTRAQTVMVQFEMRLSQGPILAILLRCQHRVPDGGRTSVFEA